MRSLHARLTVPALALLVVAGCSSHSGPSSATADRTVDVTMVDNAFEPSTVQASVGETITFRFTNTGAARHEGVIGDEAYQEEHRTDMAAPAEDDGHEDDHGEATSVTVEPGATGELTHTFEDGGTVLIGCHEPGHWEAGMRASISVSG